MASFLESLISFGPGYRPSAAPASSSEPAYSPSTGDGFQLVTKLAYELAQARPDIAPAIEIADQSVGCIQTIGGGHLGCGVLIGIDRVLSSRHVIEGGYPHHLQITFDCYDGYKSYRITYNVQSCLEDRKDLDYCVLKLLPDDNGNLPGCVLPIPDVAYGQPSGEYLLSHVDSHGSPVISLGQPCIGGSWDSSYCSIIDSDHGSSGGGYFDASGCLFAIHLQRATGECGGTGMERKALPLVEICKTSAVLREERCDVIKDRIPTYVPAVPKEDPCFVDEKTIKRDFTPRTLRDGSVVDGFWREISRGGSRTMEVFIHRRRLDGSMTTFNESFSFNPKPHEIRAYNNKKQVLFYYNAGNMIFDNICEGQLIGDTITFRFEHRTFEMSMVQ